MNRKVPLTALMLLLMACGGPKPPATDAPADGAITTQESYTLKVVFHGLVAYAEDRDKLWAFLVDADYKEDPDKGEVPPEAKLPPGVLREIKDGKAVVHQFPPHRARLRLTNAKVISGPAAAATREGLPIFGADLRFDTGVKNLCAKLSELSSAAKISAARKNVRPPAPQLLESLHQLDRTLLGDALDPRLAARALIETGTVEARVLENCPGSGPSGTKTRFSYRTLSDSSLTCPGNLNDSVELAEEVVVTQENVSQPTEINLGRLGKITVELDDPSNKTMTIEVLNMTDNGLKAEGCLSERHYEVFRWLYRLISDPGASGTMNHLYPCPKKESLGDPKCPQKLLVIPGGGREVRPC